MAKLAVETRFGQLSTYVYPGAYDSTKLGLGPLMTQLNGAGEEDKYAGPVPIGVARPVETSGAIPGVFPWALQWSSTIDWVFLADNAAAAATRRIQLYEFNRTTGQFTWKGFVTLTYPTATNYTIRGFRMTYDKYTTGTAAVSGTAVTGTSTTWSASKLAVGSRIGFGSINPNAITTWYEISAIGSDTSITLTTSAGTIADGPYVIEELRAIMATTNATATNGGLCVAKGLRAENFSPTGTAIPAATTVDNIRAVYWLADAATVTNTVSFGMGLQDKDSWTQHYCWVGDTLANPILFKYNIRAALTLTAGKDTTSLVFKTGAGGAVTGTTSQNNNGRVVTAAHGPGNGIPCFYFTTTTRIYRTVNVTTITTGSTTWLSGGDVMTEVPPGGVTTHTATGALNLIEYAGTLDKFVIISSGAAGVRSYISRYFNDGSQLDRIFLVDSKQINQAGADSTTTIYPVILAVIQTAWAEGGILYLAGVGTTAATNILYAVPIGADWEYAVTTNCRLVTPSISTPNCNKFVRAYENEIEIIGGDTVHNLGQTPEGFRVYYRTTGISDNSGSWTLLDDLEDLSGVDGATAIQFMFEFKVINLTCIPARILSCAVLYEDFTTDSHYQPSVAQSSTTNKRFAWRFSTAFGGTVPTLRPFV